MIFANNSADDSTLKFLYDKLQLNSFQTDIERCKLVAAIYSEITPQQMNTWRLSPNSVASVVCYFTNFLVYFVKHATQENYKRRITVPERAVSLWSSGIEHLIVHMAKSGEIMRWSTVLFLMGFDAHGEPLINDESVVFATAIYKYEQSPNAPIEDIDRLILTFQNLIKYYYVPIYYLMAVNSEKIESIIPRISQLFLNPALNAHFSLSGDAVPAGEI